MSYLKHIVTFIYLTGENAECALKLGQMYTFSKCMAFKRTTLRLQVAGRNKISEDSNNEKQANNNRINKNQANKRQILSNTLKSKWPYVSKCEIFFFYIS